MSITADIVDTPLPLRSTQRLRLRLKSAHRLCGHVQGAWWPHSTRLTAELPELLDALAVRLGPVARVSYHHSDWSSAPRHTVPAETDAAVDAEAESPHTVTVYGEGFGRLTLLVIPPYTDPSDAYETVITASSAGDSSTPDQLLGALHRWETEGGSLYAVGL